MRFLISLLLSILMGLIPEALFFATFVIGAKGLKKGENRAALILLFIFTFVVIGTVFAYDIWLYVVLTVCMFLIMKALIDSTEFIDLFLLTIPYIILAAIGFLCYGIESLFVSTDVVGGTMLVINRVLLIILIPALYPRLHKWYNAYKKVWNVHKDNKIKSITVRNISILVCNAVIIAAYTMLTMVK